MGTKGMKILWLQPEAKQKIKNLKQITAAKTYSELICRMVDEEIIRQEEIKKYGVGDSDIPTGGA